MKQGDIYKWNWKDEVHRGYHCRNQIVIFDGTRLYDNYWAYNDLYRELCEDFLSLVSEMNLELIGNLNDLEVIEDCEKKFFREEDIVNTRNAKDLHESGNIGDIYKLKNSEYDVLKVAEITLAKMNDLVEKKDALIKEIEELLEITHELSETTDHSKLKGIINGKL